MQSLQRTRGCRDTPNGMEGGPPWGYDQDMCGRFTVRNLQRVRAKFGVPEAPLFEPRYNIAPTQPVLAVRAEEGKRHLVTLRWGLIPSWAKDQRMGYRLINARADTVASKPSFRSAFKKRRCLIPADGFYEWQKLGRSKQPFFIHMNDDEPFALAGLWETWQNPEQGEEIQNCTIITTEANELMKPIHDRMPVILPASAYGRWLNPDEKPDTLLDVLCPYPAKEMAAYPISSYVNSPKNEGPKCIEPAA